MIICRYHIKEMIIFLRKIQRCSVSTPASTLNNTGVMLNSVDTSDNTGYSSLYHVLLGTQLPDYILFKKPKKSLIHNCGCQGTINSH